MIVRDARPDDVDTLMGFQLAMAAETEDKGLDPARLQRGIDYLLTHPAEGFYLMADLEGIAAGSLMVTFEWSDWRNASFWWIQSVYVSPHFRQRGVYRRLHQFVRDRAREKGGVCGFRLYVERENADAQRVYEALGMSHTEYLMYEESMSQ